ncbi:hypothetical protein CHS0354_022846 [Potamilus streckersoni]|uniref:Uncharacterized protein n=1 Tax=Potamilus streckersoni TaxID=2493646 RepID=A0AAE0VP33_9BIVA|nr:hypothetical protein CHS0354_022846 [Potamilus streckersoni]
MSTLDCLSCCNLINVMIFWIILILLVLSQEVKVASGEEHNLFPAIENRVGNTSKQLTENDSTVHLYAELIDVLEKLNVLDQSGHSIACYSLEKIVREVIHINDDGHRILGVYLYFEEKDSKKVKGSVPLGSTKKIMDIAVKSSGTNHYSESDQKYKVKNISYVECTNHSRMGIEGLDSLSRKHDKVNATYSVLKQEDNSVHNLTTIGSSRADREDNNGGLSRTQVVVISTCSAVIGVFFLIAGVMRVRNYLKRYREERMLARRAMQRSISGSLAGTQRHPDAYRRESSASKVSRQGNPILGRSGGVYSPVNDNDSPKLNYSQNSSPSHFVDTKPFLLINTPSSKNGSVTSSHGSIAFIDEDPSKKKCPFTSPDTEDEEDHPLLRKSPDSGNSMDISVPVELETAIRIPDRNMLGQTLHNIISEDDGSPATAISAPESDIKCSSSSSKEHPPQGKSTAKTNGEDSENKNGVMEAADKEQNITSSYSADDNVVDLSKDTDVQTVRDSSVEIDLSHSYSVTTGLTQSDNSLSDNPTYRYGNQMEYTPDFDYENFAYSCPNEHSQIRSRHSLMSTNDSFQASGIDNLLDNYNRVGNNSNEPSSSNVPTCDGVICSDNSWEPSFLHGARSHQTRKTSEGQLVERDSLSALALVDERQRKGLSRRTSLPPRIIPLDEYSERSRGPHSITINKK